VVLLPTRDAAVELPRPPADTLQGMLEHDIARLAE
jgi:hypothetical protein